MLPSTKIVSFHPKLYGGLAILGPTGPQQGQHCYLKTQKLGLAPPTKPERGKTVATFMKKACFIFDLSIPHPPQSSQSESPAWLCTKTQPEVSGKREGCGQMNTPPSAMTGDSCFANHQALHQNHA